MVGEPVERHFEGVAVGRGRAVRGCRLGLHAGRDDDMAASVNKGNVEGDEGVLHPEAFRRRFGENKQHALILRQALAVHQAGVALVLSLGNLGINLHSLD